MLYSLPLRVRNTIRALTLALVPLAAHAQANDAAVSVIYTQGTVSTAYGSPVTVQAVVTNAGTAARTALPVTLTVAGATTFTNTQTVATLASKASTTVTFTAYPISTAGVNTLTVSVPADDKNDNNTQTYSQTVTTSSMSYIDATKPLNPDAAGLGLSGAAVAVRYTTHGPASVTSITPTFLAPEVSGITYQVQVYASAGGLPSTLLYSSAVLPHPASGPVTTPVTGSVQVNGDFFVAMKEVDVKGKSTALAYQVEDPSRLSTFAVTEASGSDAQWFDLGALGGTYRFALDVTLGPPSSCGVVTALTATNITTNSATIGFTAPVGVSSYTATYKATAGIYAGATTTITPAPTGSPFTLSGLKPGTPYTVSITANCGAGQASAATSIDFTTLPAPVPTNDNCSGATPLTVSATCTPVATTTEGSTASTAPVPACSTPVVKTDVWFSMVVPAEGRVRVTTSALANGPTNDTVIELYSGTCSALTSIACNDDENGNTVFSSATATGLTPGSTIYARVWTFENDSPAPFNICASVPPPAPANDNLVGAINLPVVATCTPLNATNVGATTTPANGYRNGYEGCAVAYDPKDVWFKFTTTAENQQGSTAITLTVEGKPAGQIRVFSSANGAAGPFTEVGCSASGSVNTQAAPLDLTGLMPATTYYVLVAGYGSDDAQGTFTICATQLALPTSDVSVGSVYSLGTVSATYGSPVRVQTRVTNEGVTTKTNLVVTLTVSGSTTYTITQTLASLTSGTSANVPFDYPVTGTTGTNTLVVSVPADDVTGNSRQTSKQSIMALSMSYFQEGTRTYDTRAIAAGAENPLLVRYRVPAPAAVTAITPTFSKTTAPTEPTETYQVLIYDATGANNTPGTVLYTSPTLTQSTTTGGVVPVTIPNVRVNGDFFVAFKPFGENLGLAFAVDPTIPPATFYASLTPDAYTDLSAPDFAAISPRIALDVTLGASVLAAANPALAASVALYPNPAHGSFTLGVPAGSLHAASASLVNTLGQTVRTKQLNLPAAGGTTDFDVSNLAAGVYSLQLKAGDTLVVKRVVVE